MDIKKLLEEMSLEEKVGQLTQLNCSFFKENTAEITGPASALGIDAEDGKYAGSVLNFDCATTMRTVQEIAVRRHPHHIPLLFMQDVIHGYKTIYPIPLAMGCSFDKELVRDCANMAAKEAASSGVQVTFGPMVDLVRDARWGRVMESTGEDPYLNSVLAAAQVEGYQGDMTKDHNIAACVKHFAAYGAAEAGRDYNTVDMSERTMREFYLKGYKGAIDAKVKMIMTSFNTIAGEPATGMKLLFTDILRDEWNFDGSIISDYNAFREMIKHGVVENEKEAAKKALLAGNEIEMMSATIYKYAKELIDEGIISIEQIDKAVLRVLRLKEELGLFDNPYRYASVDNEKSNHLCKEHRALSRKAATKTSVLLKNNGVLPFSTDVKKIAVIGPFADEKEIIGSWSCVGKSDDTISVVEGIKNIVPSSIVKVEKGCTWKGDNIDIDSAVNVAKESDIVILCLGEHQSWSGEGNSRAMLELPRNQIKLAEEVVRANKNTAVVLFNGRPLAIKDLDDIAPAILDMWQPGTEGGNACAELLFGLANPEGKITMTFPLCTGQEPIYYNHLPTARPVENPKEIPTRGYISRYMDFPVDPLYSFGHGLSYTKYKYGNLKLDATEMTKDSSITVSIDVTNIGTRCGNETIMMFIHDKFAQVSRPVKELKGFEKISLNPGETKTVSFIITNDALTYVHPDLSTYSDPGEFDIMVGPNSENTLNTIIKLV